MGSGIAPLGKHLPIRSYEDERQVVLSNGRKADVLERELFLLQRWRRFLLALSLGGIFGWDRRFTRSSLGRALSIGHFNRSVLVFILHFGWLVGCEVFGLIFFGFHKRSLFSLGNMSLSSATHRLRVNQSRAKRGSGKSQSEEIPAGGKVALRCLMLLCAFELCRALLAASVA
nr:MAG TPA: Ethylene-responsive binding factor-associated repression [Caudoviricetes sp.]